MLIELLDKLYENLEFNLQRYFSRYTRKVSQVKGSFYVLIRNLRGKILGESFKNMIDDVKYISEVYKKFSHQSNRFKYNFLPYFKLVRCYVGYQYHFLAVRQDCQYVCRFRIEIQDMNCFYFCSHFYKTFKDKVKVRGASVLKKGKYKRSYSLL